MGEFLSLHVSPGTLGGHFTPKNILIRSFNNIEQNRFLKNFDRKILGKMGMGGGPVAFQSVWSLKKGPRNSIFRLYASFPSLLGPLF